MAVEGGVVVWNRSVVVAGIVLIAVGACSAESGAPERDQETQSAGRTVAYLSDAEQAVLVEEVQGALPDVQMDAARVAEAMRSTCVAILDEVPNLDRVAASHLTVGLQADLSEESVAQLMHIARAQEWCQR